MSDYLKRTIVKEEVPSRLLDSPRPVKVYLPPGYNELLSYPVVFCQDGNDFFTMGRIATVTNRLILDEGMEPVIIVGVSVERSKRTSEYSATGERNEAYKRFFAEELLPFMETRYPLRREPASRILAGDSLGGTVSLHLALDYPDVFPCVLALSGAFFAPTLERIEQERELTWLRMWMVVGRKETAVETQWGKLNFLAWNRRVKQTLDAKQADLTYVEEEGGHDWGLWQRILPDGLRHFFAANRRGAW